MLEYIEKKKGEKMEEEISESYVCKGGVNKKPTTPPPPSPKGQGGKVEEDKKGEKMEYYKSAIFAWEVFKTYVDSLIENRNYTEKEDEKIIDELRDVLYFLKK